LNQRGSLRASDLDYMEADFFILELEQLRIAAQAGRQQAYTALKQFVGIPQMSRSFSRVHRFPRGHAEGRDQRLGGVAKGFLGRPENQQVDLFKHIRKEQVNFAKAAFARTWCWPRATSIARGTTTPSSKRFRDWWSRPSSCADLRPGAARGAARSPGLEQASLAFQRQGRGTHYSGNQCHDGRRQKSLVTIFKAAQAKKNRGGA